jgi:hypothetical protein
MVRVQCAQLPAPTAQLPPRLALRAVDPARPCPCELAGFSYGPIRERFRHG